MGSAIFGGPDEYWEYYGIFLVEKRGGRDEALGPRDESYVVCFDRMHQNATWRRRTGALNRRRERGAAYASPISGRR
jgi:hypothetical protein